VPGQRGLTKRVQVIKDSSLVQLGHDQRVQIGLKQKSLILDFELNKKQKTVDIFSNKIEIQALGKFKIVNLKCFHFLRKIKSQENPT
jgi:hypothetical protein